MKLHIEKLTPLFLITVILLGGCSGCGQKTAPETPVIPPHQSMPTNTPKLSGAKQNETKPKPRGKTAKLSAKNFRDLDYLVTLKGEGVEYIEHIRENKGGIPLPWPPLTVSLDTRISRSKKGTELAEARRTKKITNQEFNDQMMQFFRDNGVNGLVTSMRQIIELKGSIDDSVSRLVNLAYTENPDDFDTLLLWVFAGGDLVDLYGEEKTAATRRLYEMNPNHPWVLHNLAKCILGSNPQEALGYAQKAQELDPRYLPLGVEGLCYFQMGDYQKALTSFRRSSEYALETSQPSYIISAIGTWVDVAENVVDSGGVGEDGREKKRKRGTPILGRDLPTSLYR